MNMKTAPVWHFSAQLILIFCVYLCARVPSCLSRVQLFVTLWTIVHQSPLSMGFSRQEYRSGLPCTPLGDLPNPGMKPISLMSPALAGGFLTTGATWEAPDIHYFVSYLSGT